MTYSAITIGPIYRTLQLARSSKAVWSASYLFSYIMKLMHHKIKNSRDINDEDIILPKANSIDKIKHQAGLFPDRIIFKGELENFIELKNEVINQIAQNIIHDLPTKMHKVSEIKELQNFLDTYLTINLVTKSDVKNPIFEMNALMDTSELYQKATTTNANCINDLINFFELYNGEEKKGKRYNTLINYEFKDQPFPPINVIATQGLDHNIEEKWEEDESEFYLEIQKNFKNEFRNCHKYIAIVQADGDNVGNLIKTIYNTGKSKIADFSEELMNFSIASLNLIKKYGGIPIYAGGDDLLFFAPVITKDQTLFDLLDEIDKAFKEKFIDNELFTDIITDLEKEKKPLPTMSYGVHISYHKFPLDQALKNAATLLFTKAKTGAKNNIALEIRKHSGQIIQSIIHKDNESFNQIKSLIKLQSLEENFISSFMYKLSPLNAILLAIGKIEVENKRNEHFKAFFNNYFNEDVHQHGEGKKFLVQIKALTQQIYTDYPLSKDESKDNVQHKHNLDLLYASLRFIHFINSKPE